MEIIPDGSSDLVQSYSFLCPDTLAYLPVGLSVLEDGASHRYYSMELTI